jgi:hypothetical protein
MTSVRSILAIALLAVVGCERDRLIEPTRKKSDVCDYVMDTEKGSVCGLPIGADETGFKAFFGAKNLEKFMESGNDGPYAYCYRIRDEGELTFCFDDQDIWYRTYSASPFIRTSRGVKIGDDAASLVRKYGEPTLRYRHQNGCCDIYEYKLPDGLEFGFAATEGMVRTLELNLNRK